LTKKSLKAHYKTISAPRSRTLSGNEPPPLEQNRSI
jgi:hypothetical protein